MAVTLGKSAYAQVNIVISQGADNTYAFRYELGDPPVPVDMSTWTARAQLRNAVGGVVWATYTDADAIALGTDGYVVLTIDNLETEDPAWNDREYGVWDLELVAPGDVVTRLVEGKVTVSHDVTRV